MSALHQHHHLREFYPALLMLVGGLILMVAALYGLSR